MKNFFLCVVRAVWMICFISCRSTKVVKDVTTSVSTDSVFCMSDKQTESATVLSIRDSVRIHDSIRIVVDTVGNVIREYVWHNEKERTILNRVDTFTIVLKDSAKAVAYHNETSHSKEKITSTPSWKFYAFFITVCALLFLIIYRDIRRESK